MLQSEIKTFPELWMPDLSLSSVLFAIGSFVAGTTGAVAWFKLGAERRKTEAEAQHLTADTQSKIYENLEHDYKRVCDDLYQIQMRLKVCEAENESCRKQMHELRTEIGGYHRQFLLARARGHAVDKLAGNYRVHNETVLDVIREHNKRHSACEIPITPIMRTTRLQEAHQRRLDQLDLMEAQELELLIKQQLTESEQPETPTDK